MLQFGLTEIVSLKRKNTIMNNLKKQNKIIFMPVPKDENLASFQVTWNIIDNNGKNIAQGSNTKHINLQPGLYAAIFHVLDSQREIIKVIEVIFRVPKGELSEPLKVFF